MALDGDESDMKSVAPRYVRVDTIDTQIHIELHTRVRAWNIKY